MPSSYFWRVRYTVDLTRRTYKWRLYAAMLKIKLPHLSSARKWRGALCCGHREKGWKQIGKVWYNNLLTGRSVLDSKIYFLVKRKNRRSRRKTGSTKKSKEKKEEKQAVEPAQNEDKKAKNHVYSLVSEYVYSVSKMTLLWWSLPDKSMERWSRGWRSPYGATTMNRLEHAVYGIQIGEDRVIGCKSKAGGRCDITFHMLAKQSSLPEGVTEKQLYLLHINAQ